MPAETSGEIAGRGNMYPPVRSRSVGGLWSGKVRYDPEEARSLCRPCCPSGWGVSISHRVYSLNGFRKSTPPQNSQRIVYYCQFTTMSGRWCPPRLAAKSPAAGTCTHLCITGLRVSSSSVLLCSLELSDTQVCEPQIRALLRTASHFCEAVVLGGLCPPRPAAKSPREHVPPCL